MVLVYRNKKTKSATAFIVVSNLTEFLNTETASEATSVGGLILTFLRCRFFGFTSGWTLWRERIKPNQPVLSRLQTEPEVPTFDSRRESYSHKSFPSCSGMEPFYLAYKYCRFSWLLADRNVSREWVYAQKLVPKFLQGELWVIGGYCRSKPRDFKTSAS